jgi:hypothetical protein
MGGSDYGTYQYRLGAVCPGPVWVFESFFPDADHHNRLLRSVPQPNGTWSVLGHTWRLSLGSGLTPFSC